MTNPTHLLNYAKALKASILQQAIEGKLVEQRKEEGTAKELLEEIRREREELIKEGKIKKQNKKDNNKQLKPITEEEIPFEIPSSWEWVRLGEFINVIQGTSYNKNDITFNDKNNIRIVRGGNIQDGKLLFFDNDIFIKDIYKNSLCNLYQYDILIVSSTGSKEVIGKPAFCNEIEYKNIQIGAFLRIIRLIDKKFYDYIKLIFLTNYYREFIRTLSVGTNINNVKNEYIEELLIPLPPLQEQKRIVEKVESIKPLFTEFEYLKQELKNSLLHYQNNLNSQFFNKQ